MIWTVGIRNKDGSIAICEFAGTGEQRGISFYEVDTETKEEACKKALEIWAARHRSAQAEKARRKYHTVSNGICPVCKKRRSEPNRKLCSVCLERSRKSHQQVAARAKLRRLGLPLPPDMKPKFAKQTAEERYFSRWRSTVGRRIFDLHRVLALYDRNPKDFRHALLKWIAREEVKTKDSAKRSLGKRFNIK